MNGRPRITPNTDNHGVGGASSTDYEHTVEKVASGVYGGEALAGVAAGVLAVLALVGVLPLVLTAIAALAVSAGFLVEGAGLASWLSRAHREQHNGHTQRLAMASGLSVHVMGGAAGLCLGILSLAGLAPQTLLSVTAIVLGATLMLGVGAPQESLQYEAEGVSRSDRMLHRLAEASNGLRILAGAGVATLGILAVVGVGAGLLLTQIALLASGAALFASGSALGTRLGLIASRG